MSPPDDPPALAGLAPHVAAGRAHVTRRAGEDWVSVECLTVEDDGEVTRVYRRAWWSDGETLGWELDASEVWELDARAAAFLVQTLTARRG